jgi:exodeoxyribonuclease (lambda-induced)
MVRGREVEPAARTAYTARTGLAVETSGFLVHDELEAGCSLDGHVGAFEGILEIKAPNTLTHLRYLTTRTVPPEYRDQIRHHLWIVGERAQWADFVSYDDRVRPAALQLSIVRLHRDELDIPGYDVRARQFLAEVRREVARLEALPPLEFFAAAPLDVARQLLAQCVAVVDGRRDERSVPVTAETWRQAALLEQAS